MIRAALLLALTLSAGFASAESAPSALPGREISEAESERVRMGDDLERGKVCLTEAREAPDPAPKREAYHRAEAFFRSARTHLEYCRKAWPQDEGLAETASQIAQFLYECRKCCPMEVKPG